MVLAQGQPQPDKGVEWRTVLLRDGRGWSLQSATAEPTKCATPAHVATVTVALAATAHAHVATAADSLASADATIPRASTHSTTHVPR